MKQSRMSKIYNSKIFWIIISLLASLALWAYVSNQESITISKPLIGVQVQFTGEDVLREERGLAISNVDNSSVNVTIRGSRRVIGALDASKVIAVLDVSKVTQAGDMSWSYSLKYPVGTDTSAIQLVSRSPETISFTVSALATKTLEVRGTFDGSLKEGFTAEDPTFEPSTITVTGSEAALKNLSYAWVTFSKEDVDSSFSVDTGFKLMNQGGKECSSTGLSFSTEVIKATLPIMEIKEVPLAVTLINGGGATEKDCTVTIEPKSIKLVGDSTLLAGINKLVVATIDLSTFTTSFEDTFPITVDNELQNVTGVTEAKVNVKVVGLTTKNFQVTNIACTNISTGYFASAVTESLTVTMRGTEAALSALTSDKIRAVADLSDYKDTTGTVMVGVKIYVDGVMNVGAVGSNKITVEITKG